MRSAVVRSLCRFLIVAMALLTFGTANAGMIGVDQVGAGQSDRAALINLVARDDVSRQLAAQGIDPQLAKQRIAAMSDQEVQSLKGQVETSPAGAMSNGAWVAVVVVVGIIVWYMWFR